VLFRLCAAFLAVMSCASGAAAATYYVSLAGHDGNSGTSSAAPWRSLAPVNALRLQPGDRVLLRGGDVFEGALEFDASDAGTATAPVEVGSYGTGRATIRVAGGTGIVVYNAGGFRIRDLNVVSAGSAESGILFFTDLAGGVKLPFIRVESVEVRGFGRDGLEVGSWNGATGYRDVRLTGVTAHGNARTGIIVYAQLPNVHQDVYVGYSRAFDNPGIPSATSNTGSGIVLGGVNGGTVERSVAWANGRLSQASGGPVGIWAYDSTRIVLQHNESFDNRTSGRADGGGFDLDQNVSASVMQYNYSHGNDGSGYLLAHSLPGDAHRGNVVRFNISENDGRRNGYAAIEVWGRVLDTEIYNNTVFLAPAASGTPAALRVHNTSIESQDAVRLKIRNNLLQTTGGLPLVEVSSSQLDGASGLRFEANAYYSSGAAFVVRWGGATYSDLPGWRGTGQELRAGVPVGTSTDPGLTAPGAGGTIGDGRVEALTAYHLRDGSPAADAGLNLSVTDGLHMGGRDFAGAPVPQGASAPAGAHELTPMAAAAAEIVLHAASATTLSGWTRTTDATAAGGVRLRNPNGGGAKLASALASPSQYFEMTFTAEAGTAYRLWLRGRAESDHWANDSVFVQYSGSVTAGGTPAWRSGSTDAVAVNLEDCSGCGISGWGWQDDGWGVGVLGPLVYFGSDGTQTIRVQTREDGFSIDQIVLSPEKYLTRAPGALKNDATILPAGSAPAPAPPVSATEIVLYAADVPSTALVGEWRLAADPSAARGIALWQPNRGTPKIAAPLANPSSFVEIPFNAEAGRPYHLWLRMRAEGNYWGNDSVHVQFSGTVDASGTPIFRIGTATGADVNLENCSGCGLSGWGWQDNAWGRLADPIFFERTGPQRLRIQPREDGVLINQIIISAGTYLNTGPQ
jgi:hypothetical protein